MVKRFFIISNFLIFLSFFNGVSFSQWVVQSSGTTNLLTKVSFINSSTGIAVGTGAKILTTTNGGINWVNQPNGLGANLWGVQLLNSSVGYTIGDGYAIAKTTNGGVNWTTLTPSSYDLYWGCYFIDASTGFIVGGTGIIMKTTNGGANWTTQTTNVTVALQKIHFFNSTTGIAVGNSGTILITIDGGTTWTQRNSGVTSNLFSVYLATSSIAYAGGEYGISLKSNNSGQNWVTLDSGHTSRLCDIYFANASTGSAVCLGGNILRTTNGGTNWIIQVNPVTQDMYGLSFISSDTGYAVGANGTILRTNTGGFSAPAAPNLLLPMNGALNVSLTPLLDWDSTSMIQSFNVQICPDSSFGSPIFDTTGIVVSYCNVHPGVLTYSTRYYWRVRGFNVLGYGAWSNIFHFTTVPTLPNAPNLLLPVNNAQNISVHPFFDWDSTSPALYYTLQAHYDSSFSNPFVNTTGITVSFLQLDSQTLRNNTRYYWRVNATNVAGTGQWSNIFNFSTTVTLPPAPILFIPVNDSTNVSLTPLLKWLEDVSALNYQVQIATDSGFSSPVYDHNNITVPQVVIPTGTLVELTKYYWRVRTTNGIGTGPWSVIWHFTTTLNLPSAPILVAPQNGSNNITLTPLLQWDSIQYCNYRVQVSPDSTFPTNNLVVDAGSLTTPHYQVGGAALTNGTTYYWRVNATNTHGTGSWSITWHFTTIISAPVAPPQLLSPPNGATGIPDGPTLDWSDVFSAISYRVQVSTDSTLNSTYVVDTTSNVSQFTIPGGLLQSYIRYFWRARGINIGGNGPWSAIWHFTTGPIGIHLISSEVPKEFKLYNNYPNPFNPSTKIRFDIPAPHNPANAHLNVVLKIYDILGREITEIVNEKLQPGTYEVEWTADNIASGIYFYRIVTNENVAVKKMVLIK